MAKQYNKSSKNNQEAYSQLTELDGIAPPQSIELEQAVLGALMLEKDAIIDVQEYLTVETFYTEEHRTIFKAIQDLSFEMKAIDLYTVTERLKAQKELTKVGGAAYLAELTQ
jgi:replicative DNA helicase